MKKIRLSILCIFALLVLIVPMCVMANADDSSVISETVNLVYVRKNERGPGYSWANKTDTFTMTNMTIDTTDEYGLRLPDGATVVLEGNNVIRANYCALSTEGSITFTGSGTLTIYSNSYGIIATNADMNKKVTFFGGKVKIESGSDGIYTENMMITQNKKANLEINATGENAYSINARQVKLLGGTYKANSPISSRDIKISRIKLEILGTRPAFNLVGADPEKPYDKIAFNSVSIKLGVDSATLAAAEGYGGESCVSTKVKNEYTATSMFYGDSVPGYWDFVTIAVAILIIAAVIATPYVKNKMELKKVEEAKAAAHAEEERARKEAQKEKYDIK